MLQRIGKYEILDRIAAGGQRTVYRARDTGLDRIAAIKVIDQPVAGDPAYLEALQREARLAAGLAGSYQSRDEMLQWALAMVSAYEQRRGKLKEASAPIVDYINGQRSPET